MDRTNREIFATGLYPVNDSLLNAFLKKRWETEKKTDYIFWINSQGHFQT